MKFINNIPFLKNKYNSALRNLMLPINQEKYTDLKADFIIKQRSESVVFFKDFVLINNFSSNGINIKKLYLRRDSLDLVVFYQVFIEQEYKTMVDIFKKNFNPDASPVKIIDLGGNIGLTTMYATTQFPSCEVIIVEPYKNNLDILCKNIDTISSEKNKYKISFLNKAIWKHTGRLKIYDHRAEGWAIQVVDQADGEIEGVTMEELLKCMPEVDILKIDIEGTEFVIINDAVNCDWLIKVKVIAIEIHKKFGNPLDIINKINSHGFIYCGCVGETTVFTRK